MARWLRWVMVAAGVCTALVVGTLVLVVGPWVRDDVVLDQVVLAVALDWRDFGHEVALTRLQYELDHRAVGMQVSDESCALAQLEAGRREVRCDWQVALQLPGSRFAVPLSFSSQAILDPHGDLL